MTSAGSKRVALPAPRVLYLLGHSTPELDPGQVRASTTNWCVVTAEAEVVGMGAGVGVEQDLDKGERSK